LRQCRPAQLAVSAPEVHRKTGAFADANALASGLDFKTNSYRFFARRCVWQVIGLGEKKQLSELES
jgi:hypothetical protein